MKLLIIRHGESEADILRVHEGRADFNLTERGHKQAEAMANYVAENFEINKIYSSTLKRAAQTAAHLSQRLSLDICFEEDLMEWNNGLIAGLSFEEADKLYPRIRNLPIDESVYGQESKVAFRERANKILNKIINENDSESTIAIVTHGQMINQLYGSLFNIPIDADEKNVFATSDTGIHIWKITENRNYVIKANIDNHIKEI